MTEDEAREWMDVHFGTDTTARVAQFVGQVIAASTTQNLIARSTIDMVWTRHVVDSAQLMLFARRDGRWLDIGTGAGFPGMVIALLGRYQVTLVEPRRRRVEFLRNVAYVSGAGIAVEIVQSNVETYRNASFEIVSARAVAPIPTLLALSAHLCDAQTQYILPRGRTAQADLETATRDWHGVFHVEQSLTDPASGIVIAQQVAPR